MSQGLLTIYRASAGSGKTYCLTREYLQRLFSGTGSHKRILAVTFTNKAANDMRMKILGQLHSISSGTAGSLAAYLGLAPLSDESGIRNKAKGLLFNILHDYYGFSIGTIDSFFQKILRAFTREIGLQQGYLIELDHSVILGEAVDAMLERSGEDHDLMGWLVSYINSRTEEGKSWNLKKDILTLAEEIFGEKFRMLSQEEKKFLGDHEEMKSYVSELKKARSGFLNGLRRIADRCNDLIRQYNVTDDMFLRGGRGGIPSFLKMIAEYRYGTFKPINATVSRALEDPPVFASKDGPPPPLAAALKNGLEDSIRELLNFYTLNLRQVNTAILVHDNIFILGILSDILEQVHKITSSENRFLISDTGELLYLIIGNDQTPFIYEKTGNSYDNFMIDEFQDTSHIQWNNFSPLVLNSMAEGHDNMVVGDVKQSIYRWRNSDWTILGSEIEKEIGDSRIIRKDLSINWRSYANVIAFNNSMFGILPEIIEERLADKGNHGFSLKQLYENSGQQVPESAGRDGGMVRIEFIDNTSTGDFRDKVLKKLPGLIENLNDLGYRGSDIGILVRTNQEGSDVVRALMAYKGNADNGKRLKYNYDVISNDSLLVSSSPAVMLIIWTLRYKAGFADIYTLSHILRFWLQCNKDNSDHFHEILSRGEAGIEAHLPPGFFGLTGGGGEMSLFETVERIIELFNTGNDPENVPYLNAFQDMVLEFSNRETPDLKLFLEWWESTGCKRFLSLPDNRQSMKVLTIHKAKGLEFRIVIIPFISWLTGHGSSTPVMWVNPGPATPGHPAIVPVKYRSDLVHSIFENDYLREEYSAAVDNLNLLYVAFTRPVEALIGFAPFKSQSGSIASHLIQTLRVETKISGETPSIDLSKYFDYEAKIFEYGELGLSKPSGVINDSLSVSQDQYFICHEPERFRIKFHGRDLAEDMTEHRFRSISRGKLMHNAFETIVTAKDVRPSVDRLIRDGLINENEKADFINSIEGALSAGDVSEWFEEGQKVLTEAEILLPSGRIKRPDRIIFRDDRIIIVDFKFGEEKTSYLNQVREYRDILVKMGYSECEAYIWYPLTSKKIAV